MNQVKLLGAPVRIGGKVAPNRIVYQPLECNDCDEVGVPSSLTMERYRSFARGGPGVIFVEATSVTRESRGRIHQMGASRKTLPGLKKLVKAMRQESPDTLILFQISHDGPRSSGAFSRIVSSHIKDDPGIHLLSTREIERISDQFAAAALIICESGADGIDFKQCHGYLGGEILRPANNRSDRFGGSFENRTRFSIETMEKIKSRVKDPSFILGTRVSFHEMIPGGFGTAGPGSAEMDMTEPIAFARMMEAAGMHYINASMTGIHASFPAKDEPEVADIHFKVTGTIKKAVAVPVMGAAYSFFTGPSKRTPDPDEGESPFIYWAEKTLAEGRADMVGVGRQALADPLFAAKVLEGRWDEVARCKLCNGCFDLIKYQRKAGCTTYDKRYKSELKDLTHSLKKK